MKSINDVIQDALKEINFEEIVREAAITKVKETVREAVASQLKSYSDFGRKLDEHIKNELQIDLKEIQLPEYRSFLIASVNKTLAAYTTEEHAKEIAKFVNEKVVGESRDEIEFSAFWDELQEKITDSCDDEDNEKYSVNIGRDNGSWSSLSYWRLSVSLKGETKNRDREVICAALSDGVVYHVKEYDNYELSEVWTWLKALQFRKTKITNLVETECVIPDRDY